MTASLDQFRSEYDEQSLGMLSDILSTLYQNPERSVLREYVANGIDAHRISGYDGPVEVTLPRYTHPTLVIRDHGDGLSREDMQRVYFSYVRSTKRDDDTQIGALGLGAKSAFALTKSWTVTNIHQGLKYVVASVNDDYGAPQQTVLVNGVPTDEHSGITVTIPISERHLTHRWSETAMSLALWLPKGSVVIDGEKPSRHWETDAYVYGNTIRVKDNTYNFREYSVFQAIMGGIGYVVDDLTKETVQREASELIAAEDFDTAEIRAAMAVHPKASLSKESTLVNGARLGNVPKPADTAAEAAEKDLARIGYAHASLRESLLTAAMSRPLRVALGDVDFMPSRESVKGTPRTIAALAQSVAQTVNTLTTEILSARNKDAETRIKVAAKIATASRLNTREALVALGIHDTDTKVYSIGSEGYAIGAHALITGVSGNRTLVTGVVGTKLYKGRMYSRSNSTSVFVTADASLVDPHIGDISRYFRSPSREINVMSHEQFKARVAEDFPSQRGGTDTRHVVLIADGEGGVSREQIPFSELEDAFENVDTVYVGDELPYNGTVSEASVFGKRVAVVLRGRRKFETFGKEFGTDVVRATVSFSADMSNFVSEASKVIVANTATEDREALAMAQSERAKRVVAELNALFDSTVSGLIPDDHRARAFVQKYEDGAALLKTPEGDRLRRAMSRLDTLSSHDSHAADLIVTVDCDPWPLLASVTQSGRAMTHAAAYLAAVG